MLCTEAVSSTARHFFIILFTFLFCKYKRAKREETRQLNHRHDQQHSFYPNTSPGSSWKHIYRTQTKGGSPQPSDFLVTQCFIKAVAGGLGVYVRRKSWRWKGKGKGKEECSSAKEGGKVRGRGRARGKGVLCSWKGSGERKREEEKGVHVSDITGAGKVVINFPLRKGIHWTAGLGYSKAGCDIGRVGFRVNTVILFERFTTSGFRSICQCGDWLESYASCKFWKWIKIKSNDNYK